MIPRTVRQIHQRRRATLCDLHLFDDNPQEETTEMKSDTKTAEKAGVNLEDVKKGLKRLLPIMKTVSALTPTKVDDAAVAFLETWLADQE